MVIGEIYELENKRRDYYYHPFIFWGDVSSSKYRGVMITSTTRAYTNNIMMAPSHFSPTFNFSFRNSQFVMAKLVKDAPKERMIKVGELTEDGLKFVIDHIYELPDSTWSQVKTEGVRE